MMGYTIDIVWRSVFAIASGLAGAILAGCETLPASPALLHQSLEDQSFRFVDFPLERRGAWVIKTETRTEYNGKTTTATTYKVCAEPPADAGINSTQLLTLAANMKKADADATLDRSVAAAIVELKGRTPAVLALRDVMYRQCEARLNHGSISPEEHETLKVALGIIDKFAKADLEAAQEQKARALGDPEAVNRARAQERVGYEALAQADWEAARNAFEACEKEVPGFRACYEFGEAVRTQSSNKEKAIAILKYSGYLPANAKATMKRLAPPTEAN